MKSVVEIFVKTHDNYHLLNRIKYAIIKISSAKALFQQTAAYIGKYGNFHKVFHLAGFMCRLVDGKGAW
ncbi:hypothetical protein [Paenibacillus sp. LPE1-1-1.1]|uniref:hypothetical protein n=1 Tax=Paenibacillus sp. LPE1-1-1.1 TaxID=3135230 RepID=UPI003420DA29